MNVLKNDFDFVKPATYIKRSYNEATAILKGYFLIAFKKKTRR